MGQSSHNGSNYTVEKQPADLPGDVEKGGTSVTPGESEEVEVGPVSWWKKLAAYGVETRGVQPVPLNERTDRTGYNIFTFWWTASLTPLA